VPSLIYGSISGFTDEKERVMEKLIGLAKFPFLSLTIFLGLCTVLAYMMIRRKFTAEGLDSESAHYESSLGIVIGLLIGFVFALMIVLLVMLGICIWQITYGEVPRIIIENIDYVLSPLLGFSLVSLFLLSLVTAPVWIPKLLIELTK
jgi:cytochrome b subunit of formate dehydrogenase